MIFPEYKSKKYGYINLNLEGEKWLGRQTFPIAPYPFLDPVLCQKVVDEIHRTYNLDFSYGGWMEDRSILWSGSYLDEAKTPIHLGIDINVPAGTLIASAFNAEVVRVDDDYPEEGGWGPRVIVKHLLRPVYMVYAHLDRNILCKVGDRLTGGDVFAKIGEAPYNGNWFPHLHVQMISVEYFEELEKQNRIEEVDGYGPEDNIRENSKRFPDPLQYISLT